MIAAAPREFVATCGATAFSPTAETVRGLLHVPDGPAFLVDRSIVVPRLSVRDHTASASPFFSSATCGAIEPLRSEPETSTTLPHLPVAAERNAEWTVHAPPLVAAQTATAFPDRSRTTSGAAVPGSGASRSESGLNDRLTTRYEDWIVQPVAVRLAQTMPTSPCGSIARRGESAFRPCGGSEVAGNNHRPVCGFRVAVWAIVFLPS